MAGEGYHVPGSEVIHLDSNCPHLGHANDHEEVKAGEIGNYRVCSLCDHDLDDEIDELAVEIVTTINETEEFIEGLPAFAPRSQKAKKMERAFNGK